MHHHFFEFWHTFWDFGHMTTELAVTILFDVSLFPLVKRAIRRHDRREHGSK